MRGSHYLVLVALTLTCRGSNSTFNWTSISHTATVILAATDVADHVSIALETTTEATTSDHVDTTRTNGYDAVMSKLTTEGTLVVATTTLNDIQTNIEDMGAASQTQFNGTETISAGIFKTPAATNGTVEYPNRTKSVEGTLAPSGCWQSWLGYWSSSSLNHVSYVTTFDIRETGVVTELHEVTSLIPTSSWRSDVQTATYPRLVTSYSDGYPVSVTTSYDTSTYSHVGWMEYTIWSTLSSYLTTFTTTRTREGWATTTQSTMSLPTPACQLSSVEPECNTQWSSWIDADTWKFWDDFENPDSESFVPSTPDCTQAMVTGESCSSMASFYFARETMYGHNSNVGWKTANGTSYFPATRSLAPGCSLGCQECSITGQSVQLYYWPPATATLVEDGNGTATLTPFVHDATSIQTVSIDGTILTSPTMYISYDILYAADSCGAVGKTYRNTILPLLNTGHLFSLETTIPYHGYVQGYETKSFNLADLNEPIADSIYNRQGRCQSSSISWHLDGASGEFSCARTEPYAPIIGVPPEARALDPAWKSCNAWYGGLFDPPRALQPAGAIATPTLPSAPTSPAATPKPTVGSGSPNTTPPPVLTSTKTQSTQRQSTTSPLHSSLNTSPSKSAHSSSVGLGAADPTTRPISGTPDDASSAGTDSAGPGVKNPADRPVDGAPDDVSMPETEVHAKPSPPKGVAAIASMLLSQGDLVTKAGNNQPKLTTAAAQAPNNDNGVLISAGHTLYTAISQQGMIFVAGNFLSDGQAVVVSDRTISVSSGSVFVDGIAQHSSVLGQPPMAHATSTAAIQDNTANRESDGDVGIKLIINGQTYQVTSDYSVLRVNGSPVSVGNKMTLHGVELVIGHDAVTIGETTISFDSSHRAYNVSRVGSAFVVVEQADSTGSGASVQGPGTARSDTAPAVATKQGDTIIVDNTAYTLSTIPDRSDVHLIAGQTISQGGPAITIDGQVVTEGPSGIYVVRPSRSATMTAEVQASRSSITIDGVVYIVTPVAGNAGAFVLQGRTLSVGGSAVIVAEHTVTQGPGGVSVITEASLTTEDGGRTTPSGESFGSRESSTESTGSSAAVAIGPEIGLPLLIVILLMVTLIA